MITSRSMVKRPSRPLRVRTNSGWFTPRWAGALRVERPSSSRMPMMRAARTALADGHRRRDAPRAPAVFTGGVGHRCYGNLRNSSSVSPSLFDDGFQGPAFEVLIVIGNGDTQRPFFRVLEDVVGSGGVVHEKARSLESLKSPPSGLSQRELKGKRAAGRAQGPAPTVSLDTPTPKESPRHSTSALFQKLAHE